MLVNLMEFLELIDALS